MNGALNALRFFTAQRKLDVRRITRELSELQRQGRLRRRNRTTALQGFGSAKPPPQRLRACARRRTPAPSVLNQLEARFGVQGAALGQMADANRNRSRNSSFAKRSAPMMAAASNTELESRVQLKRRLGAQRNLERPADVCGRALKAGGQSGWPHSRRSTELRDHGSAQTICSMKPIATRSSISAAAAPIKLSDKASELVDRGIFDTHAPTEASDA